jgi:riboflavin synthase
MFTGLVSDVGEVERVDAGAKLNHLRIACSYPAGTIVPGASIACGGACLSVVARGENGDRSWFGVDVGAETLARTTARHWKAGTKLNLERALRLGDELGGHIVTGHVDGVAEIVAMVDFDGMRRIDVRVPGDLMRFIAEKGSVALDGTSLTVNSIEAAIFSVLLVPHTLRVTTWGERRRGDEINLEVDLMARYAARLAGSLSQKAVERVPRRTGSQSSSRSR